MNKQEMNAEIQLDKEKAANRQLMRRRLVRLSLWLKPMGKERK